MLEDYIPGKPGNFLSRVPLQFLIKVSVAQLDCDQKPVFIDTPLFPHCFGIPRNETFRFDITVKHTHPNHKYGTSLCCSA